MVDNTESEIEPITTPHTDVEIPDEWTQAMIRTLCDFFAEPHDTPAGPCAWPQCGCEVPEGSKVIECARAAISAISPLIQAREREALAACMIRNSIATGHGDTSADLIMAIDGYCERERARLESAIARERERCAAMVDQWSSKLTVVDGQIVHRDRRALAAAIRESK